MGVPKFYRWISERYPCLSEVVREYQIPEFDNLYLDMNGIIHNCSHPNDDDVHFRLSEEQVFQDIFRYLEFLFRMIKPQKVFFLAVDGVAPRAKMNQQRGRRFRSAKEAEKREAEARKRGEVLPQEKRFDSNCITPGTEFMDRLHQALKWFIAHKISTDEMWQRVRVILSGHETPGEGEHKIMDFIRFEKSQPHYDANTRHCLYGLDADLIVLGLCSHEPHFSLLREEVKFLKSKPGSKQTARSVNPDVITFHLLHLSLLRNYLDHEFSELRPKLSFDYNIENIIDDWILMGFLVGNDFIPHIPHFHINKNSLVALYRVYMDVLPSLDGYLNENGILNLARFEQFLKKVAEIDEENFMETFADVKYLESKSSGPKKQLTRFYNNEDAVDQEISVSKRFAALEVCDEEDVGYNEAVTPEASEEEDESSDSGASDTLNEEFALHKQHYYETKLELQNVDADTLRDQAIGYIRAIQWNLHYYYNGCVSWSWFYPHHYAPYISDVKNFASADLTFERGKPFKPFEQLLAVLPAASKDLLPRAYQRLLTDSNSPIIRHYPEHFELDMNEKQQEWEAVVKISFIDEKELLEVADQCSLLFSSKEKARNVHGPHTEFTFAPERQQEYKSPLPFLQDVAVNHAIVRDMDIDLYRIQLHQVRHGLAGGVKLDLHYPGFPTLHFVQHDHRLSREKVKVFEMCSQGENMILTVKSREAGDMLQLAHECLGRSVFINWPHLLEAKVGKVSDFTFVFALDEAGRVKQSKLEEKELKEMAGQTKNIARHYKERKGIDIGATDAVLVCYPITGRKYVPTAAGTVSFEKQWSSTASIAPFQIVVRDISVFDDSFVQYKTIDEIYPIGARCFLLAPSYYGQSAQVIEPPSTSGSIKVTISCTGEPDLSEVIQMEPSVLKDHYHPNYAMAQRLGIGGHIVARLTGTVFVTSGNAKVNIGLGLRYNSRGLEVPGFSRKVDEVWLFSNEVGEILKDYSEKFPEVIQNLAAVGNKDVYVVRDIFPGDDGPQRLKELNQWLKSLPSCGAPKQKIGAQVLDQCVVKYVEKLLNTFWTMAEDAREMNLSLKPQFLFRPLHFMGHVMPDPAATFELYDRVVNVRDGISVPLGLKGVVIGKHVDEENEVNTVYDVLFDEEFPGGVALRCSPGRGYKMSAANLINISFGRTKSAKAKQNKNSCFSALQPAHTPKPQKNQQQQNMSVQRGSCRKGEQESANRRNGSGQEFAASNGSFSNGEPQRVTKSATASPAARFAAPAAPKQRLNLQPEANGNKTRGGAEKNGLLRGAVHAVAGQGLGNTPRPKDNRAKQPPPDFVPTQVSRQQKSGHSKTTPVKVVAPQKAELFTPPKMMTVEMLEQEMLKSSPSSGPVDRKPGSAKKRLAINL